MELQTKEEFETNMKLLDPEWIKTEIPSYDDYILREMMLPHLGIKINIVKSEEPAKKKKKKKMKLLKKTKQA